MLNDNNKQFEVLSGCRFVLKLANLYDKNGVNIRASKVINFLICILIVSPSIYVSTLYFWLCYDEMFDLRTVSTTLSSGIGVLQMGFVYISLAVKTDSIKKTVDDLQDLINRSNYSLIIFINRLMSLSTEIFVFISNRM